MWSLLVSFQVSYGATTEELSNEALYPSFFRTIPSDKNQMEAMVQLLVSFNWNWIAVISSDDEYGRKGLSLLSSMAVSNSICIAYEGLIPADVVDPTLQQKLEQTIKAINDTKVNVIVLFSNDRSVRALFKVSFELGLSKKVWLATEAWVMSDVVTSFRHIHSVGTVIGFIAKGSSVSGFQDYVSNLLELTQQESFCQASRTQANDAGSDVLGPQCPQCDQISHQNLSSVLEHRQTFAVYTAVYSMAHALHNLLQCHTGQCQNRSVEPWQVGESWCEEELLAVG